MRAALLVTAAIAIAGIGLVAQGRGGAEARIKERQIVLPELPKPVGNYVEAVRIGNLLYLSGHGPDESWRGKGQVGREVTVEQGRTAARSAGLRMLSTIRGALGSLDRVERVVKVFGMVNSAPGFAEQPKVIDGFSDLMTEVFGDVAGKGTRSAVGMSALPFGIPVEVEMILEVRD